MTGPKSSVSNRKRLSVELLEDRVVPAVLFFENFDGISAGTLPAGWSTTASGFSNTWRADTGAAASTPNSAYSGTGSTNPDQSILVSPTILVQGESPVLTFQNQYDLESGFNNSAFDQAVLDISVNGGAFVDIQAAGGVFTAGGYNSIGRTDFRNLNPNGPGWSGVSGSDFFVPEFVTTIVDLSAIVGDGDTVQFRWRVLSDDFVVSDGQRIDDVTFEATPLVINTNERVVTASGPGAPGTITVYNSRLRASNVLNPFPGFTGGIRVATGDINGDGIDDIVAAAGPGGGPHIVAYDGATLQLIRSFFAYSPLFEGGVNVAVGDIDGDKLGDIIAGAASRGGPHVQVFSGATNQLISSYFAFDPASTFGISLATMDIDLDGRFEVIATQATGGVPVVNITSPLTGSIISTFLAYDFGYNGGVTVSTGDLNGDGIAEIVVGSAGFSSHVKAFDLTTGQTIASFFAYAPAYNGGIDVATVDSDFDGIFEIVTISGIGTNGDTRRFDLSGNPVQAFFAFDFAFLGGGFVA